ncbi:MAG: hypothetical protein N2Z80_05465 [Hydrogenothermaceae bacterium]|nr:hypothetical protein [Hydrogenothermaceae bacterium]
MYDIMRQAEEKLMEVGVNHATSVLFFILSILVIFSITFLGLLLYNRNRQSDEKLSEIKVFIISLIVGWAITTLIFVYRIVMVGISKLSG